MQQRAVCVFVVEHTCIFLITKQTKSMCHMLFFVKTDSRKHLLGDLKQSIVAPTFKTLFLVPDVSAAMSACYMMLRWEH